MRALFTDFISISISSSMIVCVVMLIRLLFKKAPKTLTCVLWLLVFARLLLPFPIETSWSIRPEIPVFDAPALRQPVVDMHMAAVPDGAILTTYALPQQKTVDIMEIGSWIWCAGITGMLLYTLVSYLRLKRCVREAVLVRGNIYECAGLGSAFLLGYFAPKIYLPGGMENTTQELVIQHEKTHAKRLDNWLKLFGFLCLSVHWFNPVVWAAYLLLCWDIEDACDEEVVRELNVDERKCYSEALLACGKRSSGLSACPVAFGEISIRQRIVNVLNYRKPALWVSVVAILIMALVVTFFMTDPLQKHPDQYEELMDLLGEPMETVARELEMSDTELVPLTNVGFIYDTPIAVEYQGIPFRVQLLFTRGDGLLSSFQYVAKYEGNYNSIVQPASALARHLLKSHGKVYQWDQRNGEKEEFTTTEEGVRLLFEASPERIYGDQWDLTKHASKKAKTYLDQIEVSSQWQELYADKARMYGMSPHFYLTYKAYSLPEENASYIILQYSTGWQPGSYQSSITSDYFRAAFAEPRSWWETVLDWLK